MDISQVVRATAHHLFKLYWAMFANIESPEEALASAGQAVLLYLGDCGMPEHEAVILRDEIMLSIPPTRKT
ncbi:hypothetical protein GCM10008955_11560 [Deinococcus malanensis]|uniref:Uncharacterized protein n=2 Tax=Deinococcus malanensis TaxID=1706855 RepID=A0ABQ2EPB8_9DEIO|nr:hypothetical protein GCM10008955_11560 [Deinococcus malanensis]